VASRRSAIAEPDSNDGVAMFIVWGKKIKKQKMGFVADYCVPCQELRAFEVKRIGSASHLYYVSFGEGDLVGYERICQTCRTSFDAVPDTYSGMAKTSRPGAELISETFPNYYTVYRERIEVDKKVRNTPSQLTPAERKARIRETFAFHAGSMQQRLTSLQLDWRVGAAVAAIIPICWLMGGLASLFGGPDAADDPRWALAGLLIGVGAVISQCFGATRRFVHKHALPPIAAALAPLRPTDMEIDAILDELRQRRYKLGKKLTRDDVLGRIEQLRAEALGGSRT
jgi:hypothetical protein